ncbi:hypothetical protein [Streptomyces hiroshimensis]|nr:hypothetical protein [Streptomyces hiroshimensis]
MTPPRRCQPAYAECLEVLGLRLYNLGQLEQARRVCASAAREWKQIIRKDVRPTRRLIDALLGVGRLWSETGRGDRTLSAFQHASSLAFELAKADQFADASQVPRLGDDARTVVAADTTRCRLPTAMRIPG